jgi:short-subunit dehydrogenase
MIQLLAVVTGATSGIGAAYAERLARDGYQLLLTGRRETELAALCQRLQVQYHVTVDYRLVDLADEAQREALVQEITLLPGLAALINNAGYAEDGRFGDVNWSRHRALLDVHVLSTLQLTHAALPNLIRARGLVINIASVASWLPTPQSALYGPTKAFVRTFSETLALSYQDEGLRVLAVCPGFTVTDFHARLGLDPDSFYKDRGFTRAWSAGQVVERSFRDLARGRALSIQGWNYRLIVAVLRHMPVRWLHAILARSGRAR